jgi:hypothetical protein
MMHKLKKVYFSLSLSLSLLRQKANLLQCKVFHPEDEAEKGTQRMREERGREKLHCQSWCKHREGNVAITVLRQFSLSDECHC